MGASLGQKGPTFEAGQACICVEDEPVSLNRDFF